MGACLKCIDLNSGPRDSALERIHLVQVPLGECDVEGRETLTQIRFSPGWFKGVPSEWNWGD